MQAFIIRRFLAVIPTLLFTSVIVFASIRLIPGDVVDLMLAQNDISTGTDRAVIEAALGLDKPTSNISFGSPTFCRATLATRCGKTLRSLNS